jgi:hypothetical protein
MGNCAIDRTAYIGGVLLLLQVFFDIFHSYGSEMDGSATARAPGGLPGRRIEYKKPAAQLREPAVYRDAIAAV